MRIALRAVCVGAIVSGLVAGVSGIAAVATIASAEATIAERIAFARAVSPNRYDITTVRPDGRALRRVTRSCGWDWWPAWSPDGRRIAFARSCGGSFDIYIVDADGGGLRRLTRRAGDETWPTWSPEGRRIAFVGGSDRNAELYVVDATGRLLRRLTRNEVEDGAPAWSPDGATIVFTSRRAAGRNQLMVVSPNGGAARSLAGLFGGETAWSPDGSWIAFARAVPGATSETANIYLANADGTGLRRLTNERVGIVSHHPSWSADGRQIVFMSNRGAKLKGASLWILNVKAGGMRRLTRAAFEDADPAWQRISK